MIYKNKIYIKEIYIYIDVFYFFILALNGNSVLDKNVFRLYFLLKT